MAARGRFVGTINCGSRRLVGSSPPLIISRPLAATAWRQRAVTFAACRRQVPGRSAHLPLASHPNLAISCAAISPVTFLSSVATVATPGSRFHGNIQMDDWKFNGGKPSRIGPGNNHGIGLFGVQHFSRSTPLCRRTIFEEDHQKAVVMLFGGLLSARPNNAAPCRALRFDRNMTKVVFRDRLVPGSGSGVELTVWCGFGRRGAPFRRPNHPRNRPRITMVRSTAGKSIKRMNHPFRKLSPKAL